MTGHPQPSADDSPTARETPPSDGAQADSTEDTRVVVITPDGMGVSEPASGRSRSEADGGNPADLVEQPAKVMRIGSMVKNLLDEVRSSPLDEAGRRRSFAHLSLGEFSHRKQGAGQLGLVETV